LILAVVQGLAEMLPVSSSAHVIFVQKLMGLDPSAPEMTFLLVMLHTGTMFAALAYFGRRWLNRTLGEPAFLRAIAVATLATGILGLGLKKLIEKIVASGEVESLFNNLPLIGGALLVAGLLIIFSAKVSSIKGSAKAPAKKSNQPAQPLNAKAALSIGLSQGLCLPFRGLSRSGTTISVGLISGVPRALSEEFSFALAVVLTPPVVLLELKRMMKSIHQSGEAFSLSQVFAPGLIGMVFSFFAGLIALRFLSRMLERGRWDYFGYYCIVFAGLVLTAHFTGY
jgi:undecaprenyl-diphosphatase